MSYAEHGPRIFLAGSGKRKNFRGDQTLTYGDYVLPRKRSEGRLKAYESCTDIRAWSQNSLDNTRYIRELAEHAKTPGKIVPLNVVIDNVIGLGAQTQNELSACRRELQRYKSLTLTPEQQHQLQSAVLASPRLRSRSKPPQATNTQKSEFGETARARSASPVRSSKPDGIDKSLQTGTVTSPILQSRAVSAIWLSTDGTSEDTRSELIDNAATAAAGKDELAFIGSTSGEEYTDDYEEDGDSTASRTRNRPEMISSSGTPGRSDTETGSGTGSVTDYETDDENSKSIIIKKDSEIIALKNEIGAKEMEIDELRERNKLLETSLKVKEDGIQLLKGNLKMSEQQFAGVGEDIMYESEVLKKKIAVCECTISELKSDLKEKASICRAQGHEIEELRFRLKETELLRVERNSLLRKVNEMGDLLTDAEKCGRALTEMKSALRERDELRSQNREQSCLLADQEEEIQRLVLLVRSLSAKHEGLQVKMKGTIESMRLEIDEKNCKICECEAQLSSVEKEVDCLNVKLKNSLNSMDEFKIAYQDACNCADLDRDIYSQAKSALCKLNQTMTELKEYKLERENLLRQIEEMKYNKNHINNNLNRFCCQNFIAAENEIRRKGDVGDLGTLDLRKRKCALREELEEVEKELQDRLGNRGRDAVGLDEDLDVVASAKRTINRLNNAMLDLDAWEYEKASMQETIERLKIQVSTLSGKEENGDGENVERRIVDQASNSLAKLSRLFAELKQYQMEREVMQNKIKNLTEALKDSQSAEGCKGITMLKERLRDLRIENEKERLAHAENIKSLQARLEEAENTSGCSGVKALRQKLRESLQATGTDVKVDQALAIHVKKSIERLENLSKEIKEVDEERVEIVKEIAKQQEEIQVRNVEIMRLKKQVAQETAKRRGEGDRAEEGLQELEGTRNELVEKIRTIQELEDQLQSWQFQLLGSNKEQALLKQRIKAMEDEKIELLARNDEMAKKLESADTEMSSLISKVTSSERIHANLNQLEAQVEEMKPRLLSLQSKNEKLIGEVATLKGILSERNNDIEALIDKRAKESETTERNAAVYEMKLATCRKEFDRVFRANKSLTAKLVEAEGKISDMNKLISEFEGDRAKLEQVSNLQREITKLTKDKRKLESELRGSKNQLGSLEASNKKLEEDLNRVFDDNEGLKLEIEKLHGENVRLSSELVGEVSAREKLARLPDKLTNDISALKQRLHSTEVRASNILQDLQNRIEQLQTKRNEDAVLINELQRQNKFQNEKVSICDEKLAVLEKANSELKNELNKRLEEIKKLSVKLRSIEALEKSSQFMVTKGDNKDVNDESNNQIVPDNEKTSHKLDTVAELTCRLNHAENENKQRQTEMQKLQCDVKSKNAEINSLRENIKSLAEEREALNEIIKSKEIQNSQRLQAVKMTYEGTLKVLYENHNESIARLQTQYEDAIKDSDYFDPESWLRSLSSKELAELHDRICMTISCSMSNEQSKPDNSESPVTSLQRNYQQDLNEKHQLNKRIATLENEIVQIEQEARQKVYELEIVIEQEKKRFQEMSEMVAKEQLRNAELQRRLTLSGGVSSKNQLSDGKTSNISIERSKSIQLDGSAESEKDILRRQSAYNQDRADNYGVLLEQQRKIVKNLEMELMDGSPKEKVFDWRKKNFIHQCSTYKKYEND